MQIHVNVNDVKLTDEVEGQSIRARYDDGEDYERSVTIADLVAEKIADRLVADNTGYYDDLRKRVDRRINELVRDRVAPMIDEAMAKPVRKTNTYGEPTGVETTMRELIIDAARTWLEKSSGDSFDRTRQSQAQKLVKEAVGSALTKELSTVIAAEREKVVAAVRAQAADIIARSVAAGVGGK